MIAISTITQNTEGALILEVLPSSRFREGRARATRSATLDGGCVIDHQGFSQGDRTFTIRANVTENQAGILDQVFQNETLLCLSTAEGVFRGVISTLNLRNGDMRMTFLVKERMNE